LAELRRLQWGRDLAVTETLRALLGGRPVWSLQWGRDLAVTETFASVTKPQGAFLCFNGAVTLRSRKLAGCRAAAKRGDESFNGAVTLRSRKRAAGRLWPRGELRLQWGRDLAVTETQFGAPLGGPQYSLQWGRDLAVTETNWYSSTR